MKKSRLYRRLLALALIVVMLATNAAPASAAGSRAVENADQYQELELTKVDASQIGISLVKSPCFSPKFNDTSLNL